MLDGLFRHTDNADGAFARSASVPRFGMHSPRDEDRFSEARFGMHKEFGMQAWHGNRLGAAGGDCGCGGGCGCDGGRCGGGCGDQGEARHYRQRPDEDGVGSYDPPNRWQGSMDPMDQMGDEIDWLRSIKESRTEMEWRLWLGQWRQENRESSWGWQVANLEHSEWAKSNKQGDSIEPRESSGGGGSSRDPLPNEWGWVPSELCYLDPAWNSKGTDIIEKAMEQIYNNIDLVEDWFDLTGYDGYCTLNLLKANGIGGYLHFQRTASYVTECAGEMQWRGCSMWFSNTVQLSKEFVNAIANDYNATTSDGRGRRACLIADLAGTIIHEAMHLCVYTGHDVVYLTQQYYKDQLIRRNAYSDSNCCEVNLSSYDPVDYAGADSILKVVMNLAIEENPGDGKWHTNGCGFPAP